MNKVMSNLYKWWQNLSVLFANFKHIKLVLPKAIQLSKFLTGISVILHLRGGPTFRPTTGDRKKIEKAQQLMGFEPKISW